MTRDEIEQCIRERESAEREQIRNDFAKLQLNEEINEKIEKLNQINSQKFEKFQNKFEKMFNDLEIFQNIHNTELENASQFRYSENCDEFIDKCINSNFDGLNQIEDQIIHKLTEIIQLKDTTNSAVGALNREKIPKMKEITLNYLNQLVDENLGYLSKQAKRIETPAIDYRSLHDAKLKQLDEVYLPLIEKLSRTDVPLTWPVIMQVLPVLLLNDSYREQLIKNINTSLGQSPQVQKFIQAENLNRKSVTGRRG